ncbi:MAG: hypothetical protein LBP59_10345 [Planctomycetaceae bacterium]|nr:hypothetical protein [Planctomycetaceae bacterium]
MTSPSATAAAGSARGRLPVRTRSDCRVKLILSRLNRLRNIIWRKFIEIRAGARAIF